MPLTFDDIIFGPIRSRRLGRSLGINLLPETQKICNFDCIYCECGWTEDVDLETFNFFPKDEVIDALTKKLIQLKAAGDNLDSITFSGNGEPTLHPEFSAIIDEVILCRNNYMPEAIITVITNATTLSNPSVFNSLQKIDKPLLKLDAGNEKMFRLINRASAKLDFEKIVENLIRFNGKGIVQTMLIRSADFDNTTEAEIADYLTILQNIKPKSVMLYGLDREAPMLGLEKVSEDDLKRVAEKIENLGIPAKYYI